MLRRRTILKAANIPTGDLNTKLLLHFDGSVVDASPYSVPVSAEAGTSFAAGKFGQGFIGKNITSAADPSPITTPDGYISDIIKGDFTFECWFEESTISSVNDANFITAAINSDGSRFAFGIGISPKYNLPPLSRSVTVTEGLSGSYSPIAGSVIDASYLSGWCHLALTRQGSVLRLFLNGTLVGVNNSYTYDGTGNDGVKTYIGIDTTLIDELRISNIARWTANFTPPASPY